MAKLINYQYLRNEVDISQNVPDMELDNPIKRSQEMLAMIISDDFFNELDTQNPNFLGANVALMIHVKRFLAWQSYQFWLPKANFKSTRAGMRVHQEENSVAATGVEMAELIRDAKMWAQTWKQKMVAFLNENASDYPLWANQCNTKRSTGTGFHITAVGTHHKGCGCSKCHGH